VLDAQTLLQAPDASIGSVQPLMQELQMSPLRLVQVGMGGWGRDWATLLTRQTELVQTVACVDVQPAMLRRLQTELGVAQGACFSSLEEALARTDAEAVLVTTALASHVPVTIAALEAGKHVLIEKPFASSVAEARQAVELAEARGLVLMVSQNYRFYPAAQTAGALIRKETLGPVGAVSIQFRKYANSAPLEANPHYRLQQPLLMDMAIHHFDLLRFVLNQEPELVSCYAWNPPWSRFSDPAEAVAAISLSGGAVVDYRGSWVSTGAPTTWTGTWQIECAEGVIVWHGRDDRSTDSDLVMVQRRGKRAHRVALPELRFWDRAGALAAFVEAIRTGREVAVSGRDNLGSLALMAATIEAARTGQRQPVPAAA
jgi:predicted dehydrogenase